LYLIKSSSDITLKDQGHKAGFVTIIGKPNVGKSTLLNALLGESLSAVTHKAQTTRHRIKGILNDDHYQIVFSDTPGIMKPAHKLHERMMNSVGSSFEDADLVVLVTDAADDSVGEEVESYLKKVSCPMIIVVNKIDLSSQPEVVKMISRWKDRFDQSDIIPVSALEKFNIDTLREMMVKNLPEGPPFYEKEDLSDRNIRFFVSEIVRKNILEQFKKEVPYSCEVTVVDYKEKEQIDHIRCEIAVDRESQKGILLGKKGDAIRRLGTSSRKEIESLTGKKVYLELTVKVKGDWRNDPKQLDRFGYRED
jgi:GTP-binding protein Era